MIYAMQEQSGDRLIKIGFTQRPIRGRKTALQSLNGVALSVLGMMDGTRFDEKDLHRRFARFLVRERGFEWFRPEPEVLSWAATLGSEPPEWAGQVPAGKLMTEGEVMTLLVRRVSIFGIKHFADEHDLSETFIRRVIAGVDDLSDDLLAAIKIERIVAYRRVA